MVGHTMKDFVIWNPELHWSHTDSPLETYEQLLVAEKETGNSMSSIVTTNDIEQIITAIENETNITLKYHKLPEDPAHMKLTSIAVRKAHNYLKTVRQRLALQQ